jgi:hypothetical protein
LTSTQRALANLRTLGLGRQLPSCTTIP